MACAVFAVAGCAEKPESASCVKIAPTIQTRVTGLHFDTGDRIGLTITKASGTFVENRMMTYDGAAFTSDGLLWYNELNEESTLTAYHPYSDQGAPATFGVAEDQTSGTASSDLLVAAKSGVTPGSAPVGMLFRHVMSQLSVLIDNTTDAEVSEVTLSGLVPEAEVDFAAVSATAKTGAVAADIRAFEVSPGATFRAIVVPQTASLTVTVTASDGKNRSKTIPSAQLVSGMRYDLSVEVTDIDISVSLSGDIDDWQEGGSLDGGPSDDDEPVGEGTLTYQGETYRTSAIGGKVWMVDNLRYVPEEAVMESGLWYPLGGVSAVATQGMLYNYDTATQNAVSRSGYVQGICPEGWHLPDKAEFASLIESEERAVDFFCIGGYRIVNGSEDKYGFPNRGYLLGAELTEGKCDCVLYTSLTDGQPTVVDLSPEYGVTVRCVQDAK